MACSLRSYWTNAIYVFDEDDVDVDVDDIDVDVDDADGIDLA